MKYALNFGMPDVGGFLKGLQKNDPGLLRLKKATRVVLAACISLACLAPLQRLLGQPFNPATLSMVGMITMLLILLNNGPNRKIEQITLALTGLCVWSEILLLHVISQNAFLHSAALCTMAFVAFYLRRFGMQYVGAGLTVLFCFVLLNTMLPPGFSLATPLVGIGLAVPVAFIINFYVLPNRPSEAYRSCIERFMHVSSEVSGELVHGLKKDRPPASPAGEDLGHRIQGAIALCDTAGRFLPLTVVPELKALEIFMRRAAGSLMMLIEALGEIDRLEEASGSVSIRRALTECMDQLVLLFQASEIAVEAHRRLPDPPLNAFHAQHAALRVLLENDPDIFSGRFFFLARAAFALGRLDTVFRAWPDGLERGDS